MRIDAVGWGRTSRGLRPCLSFVCRAAVAALLVLCVSKVILINYDIKYRMGDELNAE